MSRIGRMPIAIPDKVKIEPKGNVIEVTGPLGKIMQTSPAGISVKIDKNQALVERTEAAGEKGGSLHGLARSLVFDDAAVIGVTKGFKKDLEIDGETSDIALTVVRGDKADASTSVSRSWLFLYLPPGIKVTIDPKMTQLAITGIDAYVVGEVASRIQRL